MSIIESKLQTKIWRREQEWYINGKSNECEQYQLNHIERIFKKRILKTNKRFNIFDNTFIDIKYPNKLNNGFEYTENLDGYIRYGGFNIYLNLKFVCSKGGAQTRSLREVYHLISAQLNYLEINNIKNIVFINILDGDECSRALPKFKYLLNKKRYNRIRKYVYVGDLYVFKNLITNIIN